MFIALTIRAQDGTIFHELVNISHISSVAFRNIKNVDEGVVIKMKNNDWFYTDECMDQFAVRLKNAWMEAASLLLHQIEMELHTEPPATPKRKKQPVKRKTTTRKK